MSVWLVLIMNGLLTLDTFTHQFPEMAKNADIEGKLRSSSLL